MDKQNRPAISLSYDISPIQAIIAEWQHAIDTGNADLFNKRFALDVLWGSPFAAIASGYDQIHGIHERMFFLVTPVKVAANFELEHVRYIAENVAIAYVRRIALTNQTGAAAIKPENFDELALLVFVNRDGNWWLSAAQHVPDRRDVYKNNKA